MCCPGPRGPPRGGILGDAPFQERREQPQLDQHGLGPPVDRRGGPGPGPMMDRRDIVPPMDRPDLPGLMDPRESGPPMDRREFVPPMDRRDGPLGNRDSGPFPLRPPMDQRDPGHLGPPLPVERRDLGPPLDRREFERRDIGRLDPGLAADPRDLRPMMEQPGPPDMRAMDRRDIPVDRRDFGPRGPEPGGHGHPVDPRG